MSCLCCQTSVELADVSRVFKSIFRRLTRIIGARCFSLPVKGKARELMLLHLHPSLEQIANGRATCTFQ